MSEAIACPAAAELKKLIDGSASPDEQVALAQHLDGCSNCQAVLERLSAGRDSWDEVARQLAQPSAPDSALANALDQLAADVGPTLASPERLPNLDCKLDFLDPPDKPGQLGKLAHYEVMEVIGKGGMGIVLKAHDSKLQRIVAIKAMLPELAAQASARQRFIRE